MNKGHKSLLDPTFKYTKAVETDLKKTFARVRREMKAEVATPPAPEPTAPVIRLLYNRHRG
jgi:hypothetical protein